MSETKSNIHYGELEKYFTLLRYGNIIASRLHNGQVGFNDAKKLFANMIAEFEQKDR